MVYTIRHKHTGYDSALARRISRHISTGTFIQRHQRQQRCFEQDHIIPVTNTLLLNIERQIDLLPSVIYNILATVCLTLFGLTIAMTEGLLHKNYLHYIIVTGQLRSSDQNGEDHEGEKTTLGRKHSQENGQESI